LLCGFGHPGIVGADAPDVSFEVAAGEAAATVVHVADVEDHLGPCGLCGGIDGVGVWDYEVGALGFAEANFVRLDHELAGFAAVVDGADHDHSVFERELCVLDGLVVGGDVDGLLSEAECGDEPVDGGEGIAVAKAGDDGGVGGVELSVHGWECATKVMEWSWKNRRC
jgi:hypothetical protein